MNPCKLCHQDGLYFVEHEQPDGYVVLACHCEQGKWWETKHQLKAFAARLEPPPLWFGRLGDFFTDAEIAKLTPVTRDHQVTDGKEHVAQQAMASQLGHGHGERK